MVKPKQQKTKTIRGHGHMNISNVNSEKSQCITLTYSISNIGDMKEIPLLEKDIEKLTNEAVHFDLEVKDHTGGDQEIKLKAKVKACESEELGHDIKTKFDEYIKKKGGQTTLDEG